MVKAKVKCAMVKILDDRVEVKFDTIPSNKQKVTSMKIAFYTPNAIEFFQVNNNYSMSFTEVE